MPRNPEVPKRFPEILKRGKELEYEISEKYPKEFKLLKELPEKEGLKIKIKEGEGLFPELEEDLETISFSPLFVERLAGIKTLFEEEELKNGLKGEIYLGEWGSLKKFGEIYSKEIPKAIREGNEERRRNLEEKRTKVEEKIAEMGRMGEIFEREVDTLSPQEKKVWLSSVKMTGLLRDWPILFKEEPKPSTIFGKGLKELGEKIIIQKKPSFSPFEKMKKISEILSSTAETFPKLNPEEGIELSRELVSEMEKTAEKLKLKLEKKEVLPGYY